MRPHVGELLRKAQLREWALLFFLATALCLVRQRFQVWHVEVAVLA